MSQPDYSISTPENVDLHLELAGIGNRALACLVDTMIAYATIAVIILASWLAVLGVGLSPLLPSAKSVVCGFIFMIAAIAAFAVQFAYYIFFEARWQGQTPGKRLAQIRVIEQNGQPVSFASVLIRNLIRVFDQGAILIGLLPMLVDKNERRFGDLAAGTLVIRERSPQLMTVTVGAIDDSPPHPALIDVGKVTPQEYEILVNFLGRRERLAKQSRSQVASRLEKHFRARLAQPALGETAEVFLETIYEAYQKRVEI